MKYTIGVFVFAAGCASAYFVGVSEGVAYISLILILLGYNTTWDYLAGKDMHFPNVSNLENTEDNRPSRTSVFYAGILMIFIGTSFLLGLNLFDLFH